MNEWIRFTAAELAEAERIAALRDKPPGTPSTRIYGVNRTTQGNHVRGVLAEMAFEKHWESVYGWKLLMDRTQIPTGDEGLDFVTPQGDTFDVKAVIPDHYLIYDTLEKFRADYAVPVAIDGNRARVEGWAPRVWFLANHTVKDFGWGPRFVVPLASIHKMNAGRERRKR